jgi:hypothetical protein
VITPIILAISKSLKYQQEDKKFDPLDDYIDDSLPVYMGHYITKGFECIFSFT